MKQRMSAEEIELGIQRELTRFHLFTRLKVLLLEVKELRSRLQNWREAYARIKTCRQ